MSALAKSLIGIVEDAEQRLDRRVKVLEQREPVNGVDGKDGAPGRDGVKGDVGERGEPGSIGPIGPQGPAGERGIDGAKGLDGINGERGDRGEPGPPGPPGPSGPQGERGEVGPRGDSGPQGPAGERGLQGEKGLDGSSGRDGRDGLPGVQGEKGLDGAPGRNGVDGLHGKDGLGFDDLSVIHDGERGVTFRFTKGDQVKDFTITLPMMIYRGLYTEGKVYEPGDVITWAGHAWHCKKATAIKPDFVAARNEIGETRGAQGKDFWTQMVKRGRDGKDGLDAPRELPVLRAGR